jgi:hypothetical protein
MTGTHVGDAIYLASSVIPDAQRTAPSGGRMVGRPYGSGARRSEAPFRAMQIGAMCRHLETPSASGGSAGSRAALRLRRR